MWDKQTLQNVDSAISLCLCMVVGKKHIFFILADHHVVDDEICTSLSQQKQHNVLVVMHFCNVNR